MPNEQASRSVSSPGAGFCKVALIVSMSMASVFFFLTFGTSMMSDFDDRRDFSSSRHVQSRIGQDGGQREKTPILTKTGKSPDVFENSEPIEDPGSNQSSPPSLESMLQNLQTPVMQESLQIPVGPILENGMLEMDIPIAEGPVKPIWKSLGDHATRPSWWKDAKIGMWLHWGPQSVGREGDWYAKWIYMPKHAWKKYGDVYRNHVERYGHPSQHGYKDILPLWKAERWDPDELMRLYRRAGARYVLAQAMHHDNFDLWDSAHQPWNAVNVGPRRGVVEGWKAAAEREGMRFGLAFHGDYALWWFQPAFLADLDGPLQGVPYDGAAAPPPGGDTWWQRAGLDPADLYGADLIDDVATAVAATAGAEAARNLTEMRMKSPLGHGVPDSGELPTEKGRAYALRFAARWLRRVIDAVDRFSPDLIYFDGGAGNYPFCGSGTGRGLRADAAPRALAHFYNSNMKRHGGKLEGLAFAKGDEDSRAVAITFESRFPEGIIRNRVWQAEAGLGEWFYKDGTFYDSRMVIWAMLEAISRDGSYLINIPLKPEGDLDEGGRQTLLDMASWMDANGEGIHGTDAWYVLKEGPTYSIGPDPLTGADVRYTSRGDVVFAFLMAWPASGSALLQSLASSAVALAGDTKVKLMCSGKEMQWKQTTEALEVTLPAEPPAGCEFAFGLRVSSVTLPPEGGNGVGDGRSGSDGPKCPAGWYCPAGSLIRTQCPGGSYCPAGVSAPIPCAEGSRCPWGATAEEPCECGFKCPSGAAPPVQCALRTYCPSGSVKFTPCPAGYICPVKGLCNPIPCGGGTYQSSEAATACKDCPIGSYCPNISTTPLKCDGGYFCPKGVASPIACECGLKCPVDAPYQTACAPGYYCPPKSSSMTPCDAGHYCPEKAMCKPIPCPIGTYQPRKGQTSCLQCPGPTSALSKVGAYSAALCYAQ